MQKFNNRWRTCDRLRYLGGSTEANTSLLGIAFVCVEKWQLLTYFPMAELPRGEQIGCRWPVWLEFARKGGDN